MFYPSAGLLMLPSHTPALAGEVQGPPTFDACLFSHATLLNPDGCPVLYPRRAFNPSSTSHQRGRRLSSWTFRASGTLKPSLTASNLLTGLNRFGAMRGPCGLRDSLCTLSLLRSLPHGRSSQAQHSVRTTGLEIVRRGLSPVSRAPCRAHTSRSRGAQRTLAAFVGRIIGMHLFDHRWSV